MKYAEVTILKTGEGVYYPDGVKAVLNSEAEVVSNAFLAKENLNARTVNDVKEGDVVIEANPVQKIAVTKVYDRQRGTIFIRETAKEFLDALQACCQ